MKYHINDDEASQWAEFWAVCSRMLTIYPERPAGMSGDTEVKQLERQLKQLEGELLPVLCENEHWSVDASVGRGKGCCQARRPVWPAHEQGRCQNAPPGTRCEEYLTEHTTEKPKTYFESLFDFKE